MTTIEDNPKKLRTSSPDVESEENEDANKSEDSSEINVYNSERTLTYDIWRLIFKYLNGRDLSTASIVCRTWKEAIESELILHDPQYLLAESSELKSPELENIVEEIKVKPRIAFCFCENGAQMVAPTVQHCLCSKLPRTCDVIYIDTCVAGLYTKTGIQKQIPENADRVGCMFFPNLKDFDTKVFYYSAKNINTTNVGQLTIPTLSKNILQHNGNAKKCLIMFCEDDSMISMHKLLFILQESINNSSLSLIGGRTRDLYICKYNNKSKTRNCKMRARIVAISISKPGMESWSIVIKRNCYKEQQIVAKLTEFREKIQLQKHTSAFMFGCWARIENKHVEIAAFKKAFPEVPLVCGFGNEEFGVDTLEYNPTSRNKKKFYTNYSTIFSIITYS